MTDGPTIGAGFGTRSHGRTVHRLHPSRGNCTPPIPQHGGEQLRLLLAYVHTGNREPTATIHAYMTPDDADIHGEIRGLSTGSLLRMGPWDVEVLDVSQDPDMVTVSVELTT